MSRYDHLTAALDDLARKGVVDLTYLEVGTFDGVRAARLLGGWLADNPSRSVCYHGFDLFEQLTPAMSKAELSKSRLPPSIGEVAARMEKALGKFGNRFQLRLHAGNTRDTLPVFARMMGRVADLVFVDGGHSLETVASDFDACVDLVKLGGVLMLDDYYDNREDFGCKKLVDGLLGRALDAEEDGLKAYLLPRKLRPADDGADGLKIRMVRVDVPERIPAAA